MSVWNTRSQTGSRYGKFNLRFRCEGKRICLLLESADLTAAPQARSDKEEELNTAPIVERKRMLQTRAHDLRRSISFF